MDIKGLVGSPVATQLFDFASLFPTTRTLSPFSKPLIKKPSRTHDFRTLIRALESPMFIEDYYDHFITLDASGAKVITPLTPDCHIWTTKIRNMPELKVSIFLLGGNWAFETYRNGRTFFFKNGKVNHGVLIQDLDTNGPISLLPPHAEAVLNLTVEDLYHMTPEGYQFIKAQSKVQGWRQRCAE